MLLLNLRRFWMRGGRGAWALLICLKARLAASRMPPRAFASVLGASSCFNGNLTLACGSSSARKACSSSLKQCGSHVLLSIHTQYYIYIFNIYLLCQAQGKANGFRCQGHRRNHASAHRWTLLRSFLIPGKNSPVLFHNSWKKPFSNSRLVSLKQAPQLRTSPALAACRYA